jgi:hypothetical protein
MLLVVGLVGSGCSIDASVMLSIREIGILTLRVKKQKNTKKK